MTPELEIISHFVLMATLVMQLSHLEHKPTVQKVKGFLVNIVCFCNDGSRNSEQLDVKKYEIYTAGIM